jgi:lipase (class 3)
MAETPANVAAARKQAITTDYYALGYLALCAAAYSDEAASPGAIDAAIAANVSKLGQIGNVPGTWTLDWGPAITASPLSWKANLLFAASYRDPVSKLPIFSAVVIRGTDTSAGFLGVLTQMREDLEPGCQLVWPSGKGACATAAQSASDTPYMARGTFEGFNDLIGLRGVNQLAQKTQTVAEFLAEFLPAYADSSAPLPLIVTGHSLGGCQTAPLALYLAGQSSAQSGVTVVPNSFAAPTAGNQDFANTYLSTLPNARRWFNTFDLVPMAFDDLSTISQLWSIAPYSCGCAMPFWAPPLLEMFKAEVGKLQYAHEGGTANRQLAGACGLTTGAKFPWGAQLEYQHFPITGYWNLMVKQYAAVLGALPIPPWVQSAPASS